MERFRQRWCQLTCWNKRICRIIGERDIRHLFEDRARRASLRTAGGLLNAADEPITPRRECYGLARRTLTFRCRSVATSLKVSHQAPKLLTVGEGKLEIGINTGTVFGALLPSENLGPQWLPCRAWAWLAILVAEANREGSPGVSSS